jgi:hypothetical protein
MPRTTWLIPAALFALAAGIYVLLGAAQDLPLAEPDEFTYGQIARSVANGDGLTLFGSPANFPTPLYIFLIAPSWLLDSAESAYQAAKATGAVVACLAAFPVWMLTLRLTGVWPATVAVVLTLAGTWMISTSGLLLENLAFPLATLALVAGVLALREGGGAWQWVAVGSALLATFARSQLGVLFAILLAALLLDGLRAESFRAHVEARKIQVGVLGAIVLAGLIVLFGGSQISLGRYEGVSNFQPSIGDLLGAMGKQWVALVTMSAFLPIAALITLAAQKPLWRDRDIAPLLCVAVPAVVLLVLQSGYYLAGYETLSWSIERYVIYAVPLLFVATLTGIYQRHLPAGLLAISSAVVALPLLATPEVRVALEEQAQFGTWKHLDEVLGFATGPALALVAAVVAGAGILLVARARPQVAVLGAGGVLLAVLLVQSQAIWHWHLDYADRFRAQLPASLSWVDDKAGGPTTRLYLFSNSPLFQAADFFNKDVDKVLVTGANPAGTPPAGRVCRWNADARGVLVVSPGCPVQQRLWNDDPVAVMSFHGGRTIARDPMLGQIIAVPPEPRLQSIVRMPCARRTLRGGVDGRSTPKVPDDGPCSGTMAVDLWVDSPGRLELSFNGGSRAETLTREGRVWRLPPGEQTKVSIPIRGAQETVGFETSWKRARGAPSLVGATFVTADGRAPLL